MALIDILSSIDAEIARLTQARALLVASGSTITKAPPKVGRPPQGGCYPSKSLTTEKEADSLARGTRSHRRGCQTALGRAEEGCRQIDGTTSR